jgi:hypothetical protein
MLSADLDAVGTEHAKTQSHDNSHHVDLARNDIPALPACPGSVVVPWLEQGATAGAHAVRGAAVKALPGRLGTVVLIAALCVAGACAGPGAPIGPSIPREGSGTPGGSTTVGMLAFLVQPRDVAAGSAISPEVKVEALDTLGNVLTAFSGTVRVALGSSATGGALSGTVSVRASSGVAFFDTLVISQAGSGYTLVASAAGFGSVASAPFTVFGAIGAAAGVR